MTKLKMLDCFDNKLIFVKGAYFGVSGVSADGRITVCISPTPGRCPTSECEKVRLNESHTFKSGFTVTNRGSQGGYPGAYGIVDVSYTGESVLPEMSTTKYINVEVLIPNKDGSFTSYPYRVGVLGITEAGIPEVELPDVDIPVVIPTISKTLIIRELPSSVFKGDTRTIVGAVDVDGLPVTGEPVIMKVDGDVVDETSTLNGTFNFSYLFDKAGSRKIIFESPATHEYPDYGRSVQRISVSSVSPTLEERLKVEREEYEARRKALEQARIVIPGEYEYKPIFRRDELVTPESETEPDIPPVEPEPPIPTRGSIQVDLPIPPVIGLPIEVPVAIWLDDMFKGNAPTTLDHVKVGPHIIVLKMTGFVSPPIDIEVREGEVTHVSGIEMITR